MHPVQTQTRNVPLIIVCCAVLLALAAPAGAGLAELRLETVVTGLDSPVAITHAGDERLFITLQDGRIVILEDGAVRAQPFLDIRARVGTGGERGLLSVAFHPGYRQNGRFFVNYTNNQGTTVIARYTVSANPNLADAASEAVLLTIAQPFSNHNGGQLQFGPDGLLYVGTGDGGSGNDPQCRAQNLSSLLGKMLRLDVDRSVNTPPFHGVPPDNPFAGAGSPQNLIWALGLRNPWRFSFDRVNGNLFIGDVGQNQREEVSFQPASSGGGENYGWKMMEGRVCLNSSSGCANPIPGCDAPQYTAPIIDYPHAAGRCAVTGGYVYRGNAVPELAGRYLYGDFCAGTVWAAERQGNVWQPTALPFTAPNLTSFGEDQAGEIYLASGGTIFRVVGPAPPPQAPGSLRFRNAVQSLREDAVRAVLRVRRVGGSAGAVSVDYATRDGSAIAPDDYLETLGTLFWDDGDDAEKTIEIPLVDDGEPEDDESFEVDLLAPTGGAGLGNPASARVDVADDDVEIEPCVADATTLCLNGGRFRVVIDWRIATGEAGSGQAQPLTDDAGFFWFFDPDNPEVFVKLLDACADPFNHFWVFAAGLTNVETHLVVTDTATGVVRRYDTDLNQVFAPIQDTTAFATCP